MGCSNQQDIKIPKEIQELENLTVIQSSIEETRVKATFTREFAYGEADEIIIGRVGDLAVDNLGRVYISDVQKQVINVFEPDGKFITTLGSEGRGPGGFNYVKKLKIHDELLYAADANFGIRRINIFSLDSLSLKETVLVGKNENNYLLPHNSYPGIENIYVKSDGSYLVEYVANASIPDELWQNVDHFGHIYMMDRGGEIASEQLFKFKDAILVNKPEGAFSAIEPFWGIAIKILNGENDFLLARPEDFLVKVYNSKGVYNNALYNPKMKKIPLTIETAKKAGVHEYYVQRMKFMDLPEFWPVITEIKTDSLDRLWIATTVEDMSVYEWWVLESSGELITTFDWPRDEPIEVIKNRKMYTRQTDEETGLEQVVRYGIEMEP